MLDCPASGFPPPTITWKYKDDVIPMFGTPSHRILDRGRQLLLINTQLLDAGLYTCTVSNVAGSSSLEFQVQVLSKFKQLADMVFWTCYFNLHHGDFLVAGFEFSHYNSKTFSTLFSE